jgi:putative ABC transport system permease protein
MVPIAYNVRSLAVRKATTAATAGGIALVVFVVAVSLMLGTGIKKTLGASARSDDAIVLRMGSDAEMGSVVEESNVPLIFAAPGVARDARGKPVGVREIIVVAAMEKLGTKGVTNVTLRGVDDDVMSFRPEAHIVAGRAPRPGSDEVLVGARIRGRIRGLDLGQTFELKKNRPATVVGVFEAGGSSYESEVWVDREAVRQAYNRSGMVSSVRVRLESPSKFDAFRAGVENDKRLGLQALRESDFYERQSEGVSTFITALGNTVSVFFAFGAMLGAMITMYAAVANRQREIGTLRALGFSRTSVMVSFVIESIVLAMINFSSWSEMVFSFDPTPRVMGAALLFACGMGLLGGLLPAIRAARTSPLQAIRG